MKSNCRFCTENWQFVACSSPFHIPICRPPGIGFRSWSQLDHLAPLSDCRRSRIWSLRWQELRAFHMNIAGVWLICWELKWIENVNYFESIYCLWIQIYIVLPQTGSSPIHWRSSLQNIDFVWLNFPFRPQENVHSEPQMLSRSHLASRSWLWTWYGWQRLTITLKRKLQFCTTCPVFLSTICERKIWLPAGSIRLARLSNSKCNLNIFEAIIFVLHDTTEGSSGNTTPSSPRWAINVLSEGQRTHGSIITSVCLVVFTFFQCRVFCEIRGLCINVYKETLTLKMYILVIQNHIYFGFSLCEIVLSAFWIHCYFSQTLNWWQKRWTSLQSINAIFDSRIRRWSHVARNAMQFMCSCFITKILLYHRGFRCSKLQDC